MATLFNLAFRVRSRVREIGADLFRRWWRQRVVVAMPEPTITTAEPIIAPTPATRRQRKTHEAVTWSFRRDILDRLEGYFDCIRRLRRYDPEAYAYYSRVGFVVPFMYRWNTQLRLPANTPKVGAGGLLYPPPEDETKITPAFMYLRRISQPPKVQGFAGDVYKFTAMYDDRRERSGRRWNYPLVCYVGVAQDGEVTVLKEEISTNAVIRPKTRGRARVAFCRKSKSWEYPKWIAAIGSEAQRDGHEVVKTCFVMTYLTHAEATDRIVVHVVKGVKAAFGIELSSAKSFFRDRDKTEATTARDGKRKRIFHSVREHLRRVESGDSTVRSHYRGTRRFDWKGYGIRIVLPENSRLMRADVTANEYTPDQKIPAGMLSEGQAGEMIKERLAS